MTVIDQTAINLATSGATSKESVPATTPEAKPAPDEGGKKDETPAASSPPATTDFIQGLLDRHGLSSPDELSDFIERMTSLEGAIGDEDPQELLKSKAQLEVHQREWAKQEEAERRKNETPEDTIKRLDKERQEREHRDQQTGKQKRQAEAAKKAVKTYADVVAGTIAAEAKAADLPPEAIPFVKELMGVGSPVYDVNIQDRSAVKKVTKDFAIKRVKELMDFAVKRYVAGKHEIPKVPAPSGDAAPVVPQTQPKSIKEATALARESLRAHFAKR